MPRADREHPALFVDRDDFIAWSEGILLERNREGILAVGDNPIHEQAEQLMNEGKAIGLLVSGKLFSTMALESEGVPEEGYVEEEVKHG